MDCGICEKDLANFEDWAKVENTDLEARASAKICCIQCAASVASTCACCGEAITEKYAIYATVHPKDDKHSAHLINCYPTGFPTDISELGLYWHVSCFEEEYGLQIGDPQEYMKIHSVRNGIGNTIRGPLFDGTKSSMSHPSEDFKAQASAKKSSVSRATCRATSPDGPGNDENKLDWRQSLNKKAAESKKSNRGGGQNTVAEQALAIAQGRRSMSDVTQVTRAEVLRDGFQMMGISKDEEKRVVHVDIAAVAAKAKQEGVKKVDFSNSKNMLLTLPLIDKFTCVDSTGMIVGDYESDDVIKIIPGQRFRLRKINGKNEANIYENKLILPVTLVDRENKKTDGMEGWVLWSCLRDDRWPELDTPDPPPPKYPEKEMHGDGVRIIVAIENDREALANGDAMLEDLGFRDVLVDGILKIEGLPKFKLVHGSPGEYHVDEEELEQMAAELLPADHQSYYIELLKLIKAGAELTLRQKKFYDDMQPYMDELRLQVWKKGEEVRVRSIGKLIQEGVVASHLRNMKPGLGDTSLSEAKSQYLNMKLKQVVDKYKKIEDPIQRWKLYNEELTPEEMQEAFTPRQLGVMELASKGSAEPYTTVIEREKARRGSHYSWEILRFVQPSTVHVNDKWIKGANHDFPSAHRLISTVRWGVYEGIHILGEGYDDLLCVWHLCLKKRARAVLTMYIGSGPFLRRLLFNGKWDYMDGGIECIFEGAEKPVGFQELSTVGNDLRLVISGDDLDQFLATPDIHKKLMRAITKVRHDWLRGAKKDSLLQGPQPKRRTSGRLIAKAEGGNHLFSDEYTINSPIMRDYERFVALPEVTKFVDDSDNEIKIDRYKAPPKEEPLLSMKSSVRGVEASMSMKKSESGTGQANESLKGQIQSLPPQHDLPNLPDAFYHEESVETTIIDKTGNMVEKPKDKVSYRAESVKSDKSNKSAYQSAKQSGKMEEDAAQPAQPADETDYPQEIRYTTTLKSGAPASGVSNVGSNVDSAKQSFTAAKQSFTVPASGKTSSIGRGTDTPASGVAPASWKQSLQSVSRVDSALERGTSGQHSVGGSRTRASAIGSVVSKQSVSSSGKADEEAGGQRVSAVPKLSVHDMIKQREQSAKNPEPPSGGAPGSFIASYRVASAKQSVNMSAKQSYTAGKQSMTAPGSASGKQSFTAPGLAKQSFTAPGSVGKEPSSVASSGRASITHPMANRSSNRQAQRKSSVREPSVRNPSVREPSVREPSVRQSSQKQPAAADNAINSRYNNANETEEKIGSVASVGEADIPAPRVKSSFIPQPTPASMKSQASEADRKSQRKSERKSTRSQKSERKGSNASIASARKGSNASQGQGAGEKGFGLSDAAPASAENRSGVVGLPPDSSSAEQETTSEEEMNPQAMMAMMDQDQAALRRMA